MGQTCREFPYQSRGALNKLDLPPAYGEIMKRVELQALRTWVDDEAQRRIKLGDYSQEARGILNLFEITRQILDHLLAAKAPKKNDKASRPKSGK